MSRSQKLIRGRIFFVPLLDGGFGIGRITAIYDGFTYCDIYDHVQEDDDLVPDTIEERPFIVRDVRVLGEFRLKPKDEAGWAWRPTDRCTVKPAVPKNRYVAIGLSPRRYDVLDEEPDVSITQEEASALPKLSANFAPYPTAEVEIALKRLSVSPREHLAAWRRLEFATKPGEEPPKAKGSKRGKAKAEKSAGDGLARVSISIRLASDYPDEDELKIRDAVEEAIGAIKGVALESSGAGLGAMDLAFVSASAISKRSVTMALKKLGLSERAIVTYD